MNIQFKHAAIITSLICGVLFFTWMFLPSFLLHLWGIDYSDTIGLMARRNAALFGGLCLIMFLTRNTPVSVARSGISAGIATAVITEFALAAVFFNLWRSDRELLGHTDIGRTSI